MRAIFLSDAHIRDQDDPNLPPLLAFLEHAAGAIDRLVVVGDLFHTWFGFKRTVFNEYVPLLAALHALKRAGAEITYITGNHDYEMGGYFRNVLKAEIHDTEMALKADGQEALVAHGDLANPDDRSYRCLRFALRCTPSRWLGRRLPPSWIWGIGQWLARNYSDKKPRPVRPNPVFEQYAQRMFAQGYATVILAHSHMPEFRQTTGQNGTQIYANLGDWISWRTFLRWEDGTLSLRQWLWPEAEEREFIPPAETGTA